MQKIYVYHLDKFEYTNIDADYILPVMPGQSVTNLLVACGINPALYFWEIK